MSAFERVLYNKVATSRGSLIDLLMRLRRAEKRHGGTLRVSLDQVARCCQLELAVCSDDFTARVFVLWGGEGVGGGDTHDAVWN